MVSPLSSRLLGGQSIQAIQARGGGDSPSNNSSKRSGGSNGSATSQKRTFDVLASVSGYSADREVGTAAFPPGVVSVHRHGNGSSHSSREHYANSTKRRKNNEMAFAASSAKADLARAGIAPKKAKTTEETLVQRDNRISIPLKGVQLLRSSQVKGPFVLNSISNVSLTTSVADYQALMCAVHDAYSYDQSSMAESSEDTTAMMVGGPQRTRLSLQNLEDSTAAARAYDNEEANDAASDCSTSSVSVTESDSGSDADNNVSGSNDGTDTTSGSDDAIAQDGGSRSRSRCRSRRTLGSGSRRSIGNTSGRSTSSRCNGKNRPILIIPPLLEDSSRVAKPVQHCVTEGVSPCNVISCASNATTMAEMLQLSSKPRLVTKSAAPFSILHANAAFLRLVGRNGTEDTIGAPFHSLLDRQTTPSTLSLMECMVSSSMGVDEKHSVTCNKDTNNDPVKCFIRVSPIVARKTESRAVTSVTHFAIELREEGSNENESVGSPHMSPFRSPIEADNLPMEVMG